ncbi:hypothetical protein OQA88_4205 [Cercophora sp. LCS_1]
MASMGPQLPPHLQKRKRTPEDDQPTSLPPAKATRRANEDEIPLDDDSDSDSGYGPSAPIPANGNPIATASRPPIGPCLPPTVPSNPERRQIGPSLPPPRTNTDEIPLSDSDSDSDTGPAPPPTAKRILGPAPPPADLSTRPPTDPNPDPDSDSDSDWGPSLPSATGPRSHGPSIPSAAAPPPEPIAPKRDDWMIAPPTSSGYRAPDPTKLKNRKFASGRSASDKPAGGVSSIWTETPEEKARRLANAVLGREDPSTAAASTGSSAGGSTVSASKRADEAKIRAFIEKNKGPSLVEEHQAMKQSGKGKRDGTGKEEEEEEDDPSKRAFDWEKDMKVGGQISNSQRRQLLNKAANFGGRFQKGSFL